MKKERTCNTFEGKLVDETHVDFLGCNFECLPVQGIEPGSAVQVEVDFQHVILEDNEEDGRLTGEVKFILYKGNHYHQRRVGRRRPRRYHHRPSKYTDCSIS